jgi:competence/damage-inducible protein CinA-like protein/SpoIID/LytB domain protein
VVPDSPQDILEALITAAKRSNVIILCGGLGPTEHDKTKETIAKSMNLTLVRDDETVKNIEEYLDKVGMEPNESIMKQAMVIEGADILKNENGTAPGMMLRKGKQIIIMLPGPPNELQPMFDKYAVPVLSKFSGKSCVTKTIRTFGLGEPEVEKELKDLLYKENPNAALYVNSGEVKVKIYAEGETEEEAQKLVDDLSEKVEERLGSFVFSDDDKSLEEKVVEIYKDKALKLAVAESCTGGLISSKITSVEGSSDVFDYGITCYADWVKKHELSVDRTIINKYSAVSAPATAEMARGALRNGKADIAVAVMGIVGEEKEAPTEKDEIGLVYVAAADKDKTSVRECHFGSRSRDMLREYAAKTALDMARRMALGEDIPDARTFDRHEIADLGAEVPKKKDSLFRKRNVATAIGILIAGVAVYAGLGLLENTVTQSTYSKIKTEYVNAASEKGTDGAGLEELSLENSSAAEWLSSDELGIDGVVVLTDSDDYYLTHDFYGNSSKLGCLYFDPAVQEAGGVTYCDNAVIRGSSSSPKEMLGPLEQLTDLSGIKAAQTFTLETETGKTEYRIISVYYANSNPDYGDTQDPAATVTFSDTQEFIDFVVDAKMRSIYSIPVDVQSGDRFVTLVTKSSLWNGCELVVVGRAVRADEDTSLDPDKIIINASALYPEHWYDLNSMEKPDTDTLVEKWKSWLIGCDSTLATNEISGVTMEEVSWPLSDDTASDPTANMTIDYSVQEETPAVETDTSAAEDTTTTITVTNASTGEVVSGTPVDIVSQIVEAEIGSSMHVEAIKAQAVATQTYLKYMYMTESAPSVPMKTASQTVIDCVKQVINQGIYYNGKIILATYCSSVAGRTNSSGDIWSQNLPYLQSVESAYDYMTTGYSRTYNYSKDAMKSTLEQYYGITLSDDPTNWIQIISYTSGGYVGTLSIDGQYTTTGENFRANCMHIRSAAFTVQYDETTSSFSIITEGYGHGVGMSQWGANYYATKEGMTYDQILKHYYTGVEIGGITW